MESLLEKIIIGLIGGLIAYWLANRKFVSQRWWDKQYDLYIEAFDILKQIGNALATYEWALDRNLTIDKSDTLEKAYLDFEDGLSKLHGLQSKMMMIGLEDAHIKLITLYAGLQAVHPSYLTSNTDEDLQEIFDLVKQSKHMVEGCSGDLASLGKENLGVGVNTFRRTRKSINKKLNKIRCLLTKRLSGQKT